MHIIRKRYTFNVWSCFLLCVTIAFNGYTTSLVNDYAKASPKISVTSELIFSTIKEEASKPQQVVIRNGGKSDLKITGIDLTGTHATAFSLVSSPALPLTIAKGQRASFDIVFNPHTQVGALTGTLSITSNDTHQPIAHIGLYGLSAQGKQGNKEPALDLVVKTLGYPINVGDTDLLLGTGPAAIGDEILAPLFKKSRKGVVTFKPVARYSPDDLLPFGYYIPSAQGPSLKEVATIALYQEQCLNPSIVPGGKENFDPGNATFGLYVGSTNYAKRNSYTQDDLNTGEIKHTARIYPLKNRKGEPIPNTYLVCFEPASNGDYQDYVFVITNVKPTPL